MCNFVKAILLACFFSRSVPLLWSTSRSISPSDMSPRVKPDMIPAKHTKKIEMPPKIHHRKDPISAGFSPPTKNCPPNSPATIILNNIAMKSKPPKPLGTNLTPAAEKNEKKKDLNKTSVKPHRTLQPKHKLVHKIPARLQPKRAGIATTRVSTSSTKEF